MNYPNWIQNSPGVLAIIKSAEQRAAALNTPAGAKLYMEYIGEQRERLARIAASASWKSSHLMPSAIRYPIAHTSASTTNLAIEQCMPASFQPAECQM